MAEKARLIEYDPEADVLTVNLQPGRRIARDILLDNDVVVSVDENGEAVQVQVLDASRHGLLQALVELYKHRRALLQLLTQTEHSKPGQQTSTKQ